MSGISLVGANSASNMNSMKVGRSTARAVNANSAQNAARIITTPASPARANSVPIVFLFLKYSKREAPSKHETRP